MPAIYDPKSAVPGVAMWETPDGEESAVDGVAVHVWIPLPEPLPLPDGWEQRIGRYPDWPDVPNLAAIGAAPDSFIIEGSLCVRQVRWQLPIGHLQHTDAINAAVAKSLKGAHEKPNFPAEPTIDAQLTVVEAVVFGWQGMDEGVVSDSLDIGLVWAQNLQRSVRAAIGGPMAIVARESLPLTVKYCARRMSDPPESWRSSLDVLLLRETVPSLVPVKESEEFSQRFTSVRPALDKPGLAPPDADGGLAAATSLDRHGDYTAAVLRAASFAESSIDHMLASLLWESGEVPESAAMIFDGPRFVKRLRTHFPALVGGSWDPSNETVAAWEQDCHLLRHRLIHRGHLASEAEARSAVAAARSMVEYAARLIAGAHKKFPRVAIKMVGLAGLGAGRRRTEELRELQDEEPDWDVFFDRWQRAMWAQTSYAGDPPPLGRCDVVAVATSTDFEGYWVAADPETCLAAHITGPTNVSPATITAMRDRLAASGERYAEMLALGAKAGRPVGAWLSANRLLPQSVRMHPTIDLPTTVPLAQALATA